MPTLDIPQEALDQIAQLPPALEPPAQPAPLSTAWFDAQIEAQQHALAECIRQQARLEGALQALHYLRAEAAKLDTPVPETMKESPA